MIDFWAVIGLASLDHNFLEQLEEHADEVQIPVREYGFRLSRWEMGELKRVLSIPEVRHHLHAICQTGWADAFNPADLAPCWWSAEKSSDYDRRGDAPYQHALVNGRPVPKPDDSGN
jgi:hypothetical protein